MTSGRECVVIVARVSNLLYRGLEPIVFVMKNAEGVFPSLPVRNERGESWREGKLIKNGLLSPTLSSFFGRRGRREALLRTLKRRERRAPHSAQSRYPFEIQIAL